MNLAPSNISSFPPISNDIINAIVSAQIVHAQQIDFSLNNINLIFLEISNLRTENAALKTDISTLKEKVKNIEASVSGSGSVAIKILRESSERNLRDRNIMVYGLTESSALTAHLRASDDKDALLKIMSSIFISVSTGIKLFRMGSDYANKPRPLKVRFLSSDDAKALVKDFKLALRNGLGRQIPKNFRIGRDRTSLERAVLKSAYAELEQRKQAGESDLIVAYINNTPSVINLNRTNEIPRRYFSQLFKQDYPQN